MKTLEKQTVDYIAGRILSGRYDIRGRELIALVGTGRESDNLAATGVWLAARMLDASEADWTIGRLREVFEDHLEALQYSLREEGAEKDGWVIGLPESALNDVECKRVAEAIAHLLSAEKPADLEAAVTLLDLPSIPKDGCLWRWVRAQNECYTFYPAELTLRLAQRLRRALMALEEV